KSEIEKTLATTRMSTASMGRFDKKLEGEKKLRGVKRKVRLLAWSSMINSDTVAVRTHRDAHREGTKGKPQAHLEHGQRCQENAQDRAGRGFDTQCAEGDPGSDKREGRRSLWKERGEEEGRKGTEMILFVLYV